MVSRFGGYWPGFKTGGAIAAYAAYAFVADFDDPQYWASGTQYTPISALPGYSFTRSGQQGMVDSAGAVTYAAANVPAINSRGYHPYGALTNLTTESQTFGAWSPVNSMSITSNTTVAPDGTTTADTLTSAGGGNPQYAFISGTTYTAAVHTLSHFVKMGTQRFVQLCFGSTANATAYANFDLQLGTVTASGGGGTGYIVACASGYYRLVLVATTAAVGGVSVSPLFIDNGTSARESNFTGGAGLTFHPWQGQTLLGNFPDGGPIIVTAAATASIGTGTLSATDTLADDEHLYAVSFKVSARSSTSDTIHSRVVLWGGHFHLGFNGFSLEPIFQVANGSVYTLSRGSPLTIGQDVILVALRKAGQWRVADIIGGTLTWWAAAATVAWGSPSAVVDISGTGSNRYDGPIKVVADKAGAFPDDASIVTALGSMV